MSLRPSGQADNGANEENDDEGGDTAQSRAYKRSAQYFLGERALEPYSALRENAAFEMGFRGSPLTEADIITMETTVYVPVMVPKMKGKKPVMDGEKPVMEQAMETVDGKEVPKTEPKTRQITIYKQFVKDVQIVIWLCLQADSACFKAIRKPDSALGDCLKWATENGIRIGSKAFEEAAKTYAEIMEDLSASFAKPEPEKGGGPRAEPGNS